MVVDILGAMISAVLGMAFVPKVRHELFEEFLSDLSGAFGNWPLAGGRGTLSVALTAEIPGECSFIV